MFLLYLGLFYQDQEGWIKKGWSKGGPPFRRVDLIWVDQRKVVEGWPALRKDGCYRGESTKSGSNKGAKGGRKLNHVFLSLNIFQRKKINR